MFSRVVLGVAGFSIVGAFVAPELVKSLASTVKPTPDYHAMRMARDAAASVQTSLHKSENYESKSPEEREEYDRHDYFW